MARTFKFAALAAALMLSASVVGASAFTSATVERDVTVNVNDDTNAAVQLDEGAGTSINSDGELTFAHTNLNPNSEFTYGDKSKPSETAAFTITSGEAGDVKFGYSSSGSGATVTFTIYEGGSDEDPATVTSGGSTTLDLTNNTYYVVIDVNTGASSDDDYTGTIDISS